MMISKAVTAILGFCLVATSMAAQGISDVRIKSKAAEEWVGVSDERLDVNPVDTTTCLECLKLLTGPRLSSFRPLQVLITPMLMQDSTRY